MKTGKLVCVALSSFQKFVANDGVSADSRAIIISTLTSIEKIKDESACLRILQTALTMMQNATFADDDVSRAV